MLAIVIPYYKLTFFEATLQSLANQTNKRFKVYIGDDASINNPDLLLHKFQGQFEFVYHRFKNNLGSISLVQHWDRCISLVQNEGWIMILGDDDVLGANCVAEFYLNIEKIQKTSNIVRFSSCNIDENGKKISKVFQNPIIESSIDFFFRERRSSLSEYVFNKKKILGIGLKDFPLAWCTDILAVLEVSDFGNVFSINDAIVYVRISDKSISGNKRNQELKSKAAFYFLYYLITKKERIFNISQRDKLIKEITGIYLNNKKNTKLFLKLSMYFLNNFLLYDYFNFIKSILLSFQQKLKKLNYEK